MGLVVSPAPGHRCGYSTSPLRRSLNARRVPTSTVRQGPDCTSRRDRSPRPAPQVCLLVEDLQASGARSRGNRKQQLCRWVARGDGERWPPISAPCFPRPCAPAPGEAAPEAGCLFAAHKVQPLGEARPGPAGTGHPAARRLSLRRAAPRHGEAGCFGVVGDTARRGRSVPPSTPPVPQLQTTASLAFEAGRARSGCALQLSFPRGPCRPLATSDRGLSVSCLSIVPRTSSQGRPRVLEGAGPRHGGVPQPPTRNAPDLSKISR